MLKCYTVALLPKCRQDGGDGEQQGLDRGAMRQRNGQRCSSGAPDGQRPTLFLVWSLRAADLVAIICVHLNHAADTLGLAGKGVKDGVSYVCPIVVFGSTCVVHV